MVVPIESIKLLALRHFVTNLRDMLKDWVKEVDVLMTKLDNHGTTRISNKTDFSSQRRQPFNDKCSSASPGNGCGYGNKNWNACSPRANDNRPESSRRKTNGYSGQWVTKPITEERRRARKIRCWECGEVGHLRRYCDKRRNQQDKKLKSKRTHKFLGYVGPEAKNWRETEQAKVPTRNVEINGQKTKMLLDTGAEVSLMDSDYYEKIGAPRLKEKSLNMKGVASGTTLSEGYCEQEVKVDNVVVRPKFYITKNLPYDLIIGMDVINGFRPIFESKVVDTTNGQGNDEGLGESGTDTNAPTVRRPITEGHDFGESTQAIGQGEMDIEYACSNRAKEEILKLTENYKPNKIRETEIKMSIILSDEIPIRERPRRFSPKEREVIHKQVQEWIDQGIVRPSYSDYAAPVVLTKKKDGSYRLCIDFRKLNRKVIRDRYPLPLIDDVIDQLQGSQVFTTLDLKNGFFHVEIKEECRKYTAFVTHEGEYEFMRCPFGLCTSSSQFQRYVNTVFRDLIAEGTIIVYVDDFIVPAKNEREAVERLRRVLQVASENGLEINFKKCQFLKKKINFLGYIIEDGTIKPSSAKTAAVKNFPQPKSARQLQQFLGLTGYFRRFVPNYAQVAKPLSDMLRKGNSFQFESEQAEAFNKLREALASEPVLHLFRQGAPLELHTDASCRGFGAVLLQQGENGEWHPIQYMSRKTSSTQEKYCSYELEMLAIIEALKKFKCYLMGTRFKIITDCAAYQKTLSKKDIAPKVARWALALEEFEYEVIHRSGKQMRHVDALSRNPVLIITREKGEVTKRIIAAQEEDEELKTLREKAKCGEGDFFVRAGVLYKFENGRELLVLPKNMQREVVSKIHCKGHFASAKTEELVRQEYFAPRLREQVESVVANCIECILHDRKRGKKEGYLHTIPKEDTPLSTYHIDHVGPLTDTSKGYRYIFTIVDAFSKFTWFYPVKTTTAKEVLEKLKFQQTMFGNPSRIVSDRGTAFTAKEFEDYCKDNEIAHVKITTGMPRGNGQIERIHAVLIPVLAKMSRGDDAKWYSYVPTVQRIINSTTTRSTKYSPFELMFGVKMKNKEDTRIIEILEEERENRMMDEREELREEAKANILKIQEENRKQFNKGRKEPRKYEVGDTVAIQRTQYGNVLKLKEKFHGPYRVTKVKPNERYDMEKIGNHEGPTKTSSAAEFMKPWAREDMAMGCIVNGKS